MKSLHILVVLFATLAASAATAQTASYTPLGNPDSASFMAGQNVSNAPANGTAQPRTSNELEELLAEAQGAGISKTYELMFRLHDGGLAGFSEDKTLAIQFLEQGCETGNPRCLLAWVGWSAEQPERDLEREAGYLRHIRTGDQLSEMTMTKHASYCTTQSTRSGKTSIVGLQTSR